MTARQQQIANFIDAFWRENWTSPNVRQICDGLGIASPSTAHHHLTLMTEIGILERKRVDRYRVLYRRVDNYPAAPTARCVR